MASHSYCPMASHSYCPNGNSKYANDNIYQLTSWPSQYDGRQQARQAVPPGDHRRHAINKVRDKIEGLPEKFVFQDFRHYFASLLIGDGADIKTVQARLRHATASTTLDTYAHLWPLLRRGRQ
jgi:integrase